MSWKIRKSFKIFAPGSSLRKRVGYSLAIVRLILVPVIFLSVYYLFAMGRIVDRIAFCPRTRSIFGRTRNRSRRRSKSWFVLGILSLTKQPSFKRIWMLSIDMSSDSHQQFRQWGSRGKNPWTGFARR